jgi:hypothetical protein
MPASHHSSSDHGLHIRVAPEEVAYWHWPLRDSGWGGWFTMGIVFGLPVLGGWASESVAMGLLTLVSLLIVSWQTWLPMWVEIGPSGVTRQALGRRHRIPWTAIMHYEVCLYGVLMLPDAAVTRISALRGFYLHWGKHRTEVLACFEYYLHDWAGSQTTGNESTEMLQNGP